MVYYDNSITVVHHIDMAKSVIPPVPYSKSKQINQILTNRRPSAFPNHLNFPACEQSRYALIDVMILIVVIGASCFLLYPCLRILAHKALEIAEEAIDLMSEEIADSPMIFGFLGLAIVFSVVTLAIVVYTDRTCGKRCCKGLRKEPKFDIQVETEECVKKSTYLAKGAMLERGLFELSRDHYRELEAELKKLAPVNGKAVLVFRMKCGCSAGRMEVLGPKRSRKVKK